MTSTGNPPALDYSPDGLREQLRGILDFDAHGAIQQSIYACSKSRPEVWAQFFPAWHAVPLRLLWCANHDANFVAAFRLDPELAAWERRHRQDREAFGFFVTGMAALDVCFHALYAVGSLASPHHFPIVVPDDVRRISASRTAARYTQAWPKSPEATAIQAVVSHDRYAEWRRIRNALVHHSEPGRIIFGSTTGPPPDDRWNHAGVEIVIDKTTTSSRFKWLATSIEGLQDAAKSTGVRAC